MKKLTVLLLALPLLFYVSAFSQKKLKKADRQIISNMQAHVNFLSGQNVAGIKAGSEDEKIANDYIAKHFLKSGLKARGDKDWYQPFEIYDGKDIRPSSMLKINDEALVLYKDYFPFAFSANKNTEAAVAIALAENDVPWFKDLGELMSDADSCKTDTIDIIRKKAKHATDKGASALIIYSKSGTADLQYNRYDRSAPLEIPVLYITRNAFKKYAKSELDIIDVKLNVELEEKNRTGNNIIGYADNGADSSVIASANLENYTGVAALLEVARLIKGGKSRSKKNILFIVYSGEKQGANGAEYFKEHPAINIQNVSHSVKLDSVAENIGEPKGLNLVKRSVDILRNN